MATATHSGIIKSFKAYSTSSFFGDSRIGLQDGTFYGIESSNDTSSHLFSLALSAFKEQRQVTLTYDTTTSFIDELELNT